jgi:uncharacterized protein
MKNILLFFLLFVSSWMSLAQDYPEPSNPPRLVNDFAGVLSTDENQLLEQKLRRYNDTTSTQIAVIIIRSIGQYEIAEYATELARRWGIGQKDKNNGVLILVAVNDRKVNISPGYGLEGAIPDARAKQIIDTQIRPNFKANQYYKGLDEATDRIVQLASGEYTAEDMPDSNSGSGRGSYFWVIIVLIILFVLFGRRRNNRRGGGGGIGGAFFPPFITFGSGGSSSGGWGGGGGSDFGGFGGGSFGGGGASGDW